MSENILTVEIVTPQKAIYSGKANSVSVPGSQSPFQALVNHAPIISALDEGIVKISEVNDNKLNFKTSKGFVEINKNHVSILVETAKMIDNPV
jgi:F-type H+-transporting ATPase subunit epsilon